MTLLQKLYGKSRGEAVQGNMLYTFIIWQKVIYVLKLYLLIDIHTKHKSHMNKTVIKSTGLICILLSVAGTVVPLASILIKHDIYIDKQQVSILDRDLLHAPCTLYTPMLLAVQIKPSNKRRCLHWSILVCHAGLDLIWILKISSHCHI